VLQAGRLEQPIGSRLEEHI